jgi:hypothetical protein
MARHNRKSGRMTDPAASAVLAAFDAAEDAGFAFRGLLSRRGPDVAPLPPQPDRRIRRQPGGRDKSSPPGSACASTMHETPGLQYSEAHRRE